MVDSFFKFLFNCFRNFIINMGSHKRVDIPDPVLKKELDRNIFYSKNLLENPKGIPAYHDKVAMLSDDDVNYIYSLYNLGDLAVVNACMTDPQRRELLAAPPLEQKRIIIRWMRLLHNNKQSNNSQYVQNIGQNNNNNQQMSSLDDIKESLSKDDIIDYELLYNIININPNGLILCFFLLLCLLLFKSKFIYSFNLNFYLFIFFLFIFFVFFFIFFF